MLLHDGNDGIYWIVGVDAWIIGVDHRILVPSTNADMLIFHVWAIFVENVVRWCEWCVILDVDNLAGGAWDGWRYLGGIMM